METTIPSPLAIRTGTYKLDKVHSHAGFSLKRMGSTFRGSFGDFSAELTAGPDGAPVLAGEVEVASVQVKEPDLAMHLMSPDFFDERRFPRITFTSDTLTLAPDGSVEMRGTLAIRGVSEPVEAVGTWEYIPEDQLKLTRIGIDLEATVDRLAYKLDVPALLPTGAPVLARNVKLNVELHLIHAGS